MNRRTLALTLAALAAGFLIVVLVTFSRSLLPSERARALGPVYVDIQGMKPGEFRSQPTRHGPVFVYRPSAQTWEDLRKFDYQVRDPRIDRFNRELGVFIYYGYSTYLGCGLQHRPKTDPTMSEYRRDWPGGYFDPCHGTLYDYGGRVVKGNPATLEMYAVNIRSVEGADGFWVDMFPAR